RDRVQAVRGRRGSALVEIRLTGGRHRLQAMPLFSGQADKPVAPFLIGNAVDGWVVRKPGVPDRTDAGFDGHPCERLAGVLVADDPLDRPGGRGRVVEPGAVEDNRPISERVLVWGHMDGGPGPRHGVLLR